MKFNIFIFFIATFLIAKNYARECGKGIGKCKNGECCNLLGYCGKGLILYCGIGCQKKYGQCAFGGSTTTTTKTATTTTTTTTSEVEPTIATTSKVEPTTITITTTTTSKVEPTTTIITITNKEELTTITNKVEPTTSTITSTTTNKEEPTTTITSTTTSKVEQTTITITTTTTSKIEPTTTIITTTNKEEPTTTNNKEKPTTTIISATTNKEEQTTTTNKEEPTTTIIISATTNKEEQTTTINKVELTTTIITSATSNKEEQTTTINKVESTTTIITSATTSKEEPTATIITSATTSKEEPTATINTSATTSKEEQTATINTSATTSKEEQTATINTSATTSKEEPTTTINEIPTPIDVFHECVDITKKQWVLTFDDGPYIHDDALLDLLKSKNVTATFFVNGNTFMDIRSVEGRRIIQRIYNEGHTIGSHTYNHIDLTAHSTEEIIDDLLQLEAALKEIIGVKPRFIRPPYGRGAYYDNIQETLQNLGYTSIIMWEVDPADWENKGDIEYATREMFYMLGAPFIVVNHNRYDDMTEESLLNLISAEIEYMESVGYTTVSLPECIERAPYKN